MFSISLMIVPLLFLLTGPVLSSGQSTQQQYSALRFGQNRGSYIDFSPDMTPFREKFTLCSWVKRLGSNTHSVWFSYSPTGAYTEILIGDSGYYNYIFGSNHGHVSDFSSVSQGTWHHYCASWGIESHTWRLYLNGQLIGTHATTSGRTLKVDGSRLVLGNYAVVVGGSDDRFIFGGELSKLNMFSKELSASEILEMYSGGLCSEIEKQYTSTRLLKWEDILQQDRNGEVVEIDTDCRPTDQSKIFTKEELDELLAELNVTKSKLNQTLETLEKKESDLEEAATEIERKESDLEEAATEIERKESDLQEAITDLENANSRVEKLSSQFNDTLAELQQIKIDLTEVKVQLENTSSQLENATICECPESQENTSRWDVLFTKRFFNKVLTQELLEELRTNWDLLGEFVGSTLSGAVIRHFKVFYEYQESGCRDE